MGLSEHSSDKIDLPPGEWLLLPAAEKENVTLGRDKRSLGRVVMEESYCMVRGIFNSKYPGVVSLPVEERCYCELAS